MRRGELVLAGRAAAVAGVVARASYRLLRARPPGGGRPWARTNFRGETVSLLEGPALVAGAVAGTAAARGVPVRVRTAAALVTVAAAAVGRYDDVSDVDVEVAPAGRRLPSAGIAGAPKGLAGHLQALAKGEVTSGAVKVAGLGAAGLVAGALVRGPGWDAVLVGGVIAGSGNLANLLDLRPGRALKSAVLPGAAIVVRGGAAAPVVAAGVGAGLALIPDDLAARCMLGDAGANSLGALVGLGLAAAASRRRLLTVLSFVVALTAASEIVSFTRVIEATPGLRELDRLGRRP